MMDSGQDGNRNWIRGDLREDLNEIDEDVKNEARKQVLEKLSVRNESSSDLVPRFSDVKLEDQLTNAKLTELQHIFEEADEDGGGGLDMDEFRYAMRQAMGNVLSDHELDLMFMKVDTNCDGTVDWDEYLSYMLLEYKEKDNMSLTTAEKPFPQRMDCVPNMNCYQRHHDTIIKIAYQPQLKKVNTLYKDAEDLGAGRYITITKEGIVNFWSMDLKHMRTVHLDPNKRHSTWVTDMAVLTNLNAVAVTTTASTLTIYDMQLHNFIKRFQVYNFETCITCLDYWVDPKDISHCLLLMGDSRGNISALEFKDCPIICVVHMAGFKGKKSKHDFKDVLKGGLCGLRGFKLPRVHNDFVLFVKYLPPLDCFISCCRENKTALFLGDIEGRKTKAYFKVRKGIYCFDYCAYTNIIVTGGKDGIVRAWNPYVPSKPVMHMHGHKNAIVQLIIHEARDQVISVSEMKDIVIFDMSTQIIVQNIFQKWVHLGPRPISSAFFNKNRNALLLATNQLAIFEHKEEDIRSQQLISHGKAVNVVLYNSLFEQVVSGGADSLICVWDKWTGVRVIQFTAHQTILNTEVIYFEITAMSFDRTLRRLITAARDGLVKIWNFNNGACLRVLSGDKEEISYILWQSQRIITGGWSRRLNIYLDHPDEQTVQYLKGQHQEDIMALAGYPPNIIASASYDGDIFIWSMETGLVTARFNPYLCVGPWYGKLQPSQCRTSPRAASPPGCMNSDINADTGQEAVNTLVFLQTRENTKVIATLFSGSACGWVRAWSIHADGGLRGQFNAAHHRGESVTTLTTDPQNELLITGDSEGYIKVWYVTPYCNAAQETNSSFIQEILGKKYFPFMQLEPKIRNRITNQRKHDPPPKTSCPEKTIKVPQLLNSYRAHLQGITSLAYIARENMLVSSSSDCSLRLWKLNGEFIGIFGQSPQCWQKSWPINRGAEPKCDTPADRKQQQKDRLVPPDIRKVASACSLQVLLGGVQANWKLARNIAMIWVPLVSRTRRNSMLRQQDIMSQFNKKELTSIDPVLEDIEDDKYTKSSILGMTYKPTRRHRAMPRLPKIRQFQNQYAVYSSLPYHDIEDSKITMATPATILEIQERNKGLNQLHVLQEVALFDPRTGLPYDTDAPPVGDQRRFQRKYLPPVNKEEKTQPNNWDKSKVVLAVAPITRQFSKQSNIVKKNIRV